MSTWVSVPKLAARAKMTRQGMWKALLALDSKADGKLLRRNSRTGRGGRYEVCLEVLERLKEADFIRQGAELDAITTRVENVETGLTAVRNALGAHRRKTEKRFDQQEEKLAALKRLSEAAAELSRVFAVS